MKAADKIREALNSGPIKDYTYAILFFFVSSFFIVFVIRPVLSIAVSLQKEAVELEEVNKVYEENITRVLKLQSDLEQVRDRKHLLTEALPERANIKPLLDDIQKAAQEQGIQLDKVAVSGIYLKESSADKELATSQLQPGADLPSTQIINLQLNITGSYDQTRNFIAGLLNQRRIKNVESFTTRNIEFLTKSASTGLQLDLKIESYYL